LKIERPEISGLIVLFIGVGLLAFTFLNAYWLLSGNISIIASQDIMTTLGQALAPLMVTVIRIMYLGIMGWIGSLLTLRGIPLVTHARTQVSQPPQSPEPTAVTGITEAKPSKKEEKTKEKLKQEEIEKPRPPEAKPKEEPKKPEQPEKPEITIEVRPQEEVAAEASKKPSTPPQSLQ
jgi:outer membrane biosynthesis protein TonB